MHKGCGLDLTRLRIFTMNHYKSEHPRKIYLPPEKYPLYGIYDLTTPTEHVGMSNFILSQENIYTRYLCISVKGGVPPHPLKKNSGLLTQKLLAASNGELYTAMLQNSNIAHTKNDSRRIILTQVTSDHIIETTSITPQRPLGCIG